jgi:hypothetical protein
MRVDCFNKLKTVCFLIDHPFDLVLCHGLKNLLNKQNVNFTSVALITDHKYFEKCKDYEVLVSEFDRVELVRKPIISKYIFNNIFTFFLFIRKIKKINKFGNVFYIVLSQSEPSVQLIMKYSRHSIVRLLQKSFHSENSNDIEKSYLVDTKVNLIRNFYEILFRLPISVTRITKKSKYIRLVRFKNQQLTKDFFLVNINEKPLKNEINFPYYFKNSNFIENKKTLKKVYYLGSRIFDYEFILDENVANKVNNILRKIEEFYGNEVEYIYKPHPVEKDTVQNLDLNKFKVIETDNSAEIEYIKNFNNIEAVYSFGSTSSKTAFNFGINAYVLYKLFNINSEIESIYNRQFIGLPNSFFVLETSNIAPIIHKESNNLSIENLIRDL